eukprot:471397_1
MDQKADITIDYDKMTLILCQNNMNINGNAIKTAFTQHKYNKEQLVTDLCNILFTQSDLILLREIFINKLNINSGYQLEKIYYLIMYNFLVIQDLNQFNFLKMLKFKALKLNTDIDPEDIETIAKQHALTGNIFVKGTQEFKNSTQFGLLFKNTKHYNKKMWAKIYRQMNQWKPVTLMPVAYSFGIKYWYKKWRKPFGQTKKIAVIIESHFSNLKEEVINDSGKILLNQTRWEKEMTDAQINQQREVCKKYCINTKDSSESKIKANTHITIEHLIAVQLYCNSVKQKEFSGTYRIKQYDDEKTELKQETLTDVAKEHSFYANWGRLLYEAVNVFGNRPYTKTYFVHGIDREMLFEKTITG